MEAPPAPVVAGPIGEGLDQALARHSVAPVDEEWAAEMRSAIDSGIAAHLTDLRATASPADCRTNTCLVVLRYPDVETARQYGSAAATTYFPGANCMQQVTLLPPDESDLAGVRAALLFRCPVEEDTEE